MLPCITVVSAGYIASEAGVGGMITAEFDAVHPFWSVTVILYVPALRFESLAVVLLSLHR